MKVRAPLDESASNLNIAVHSRFKRVTWESLTRKKLCVINCVVPNFDVSGMHYVNRTPSGERAKAALGPIRAI